MNYEEFRRAVGDRIRMLRMERQITQEEMDSGDDGIPYRTIQNIETGRSNPNLRTIYRLARRLGVPPEEIFKVKFK